MQPTPRLYSELLKFVRQLPWSDWRHVKVLCWMLVGLLMEGKVHLSQWGHHVQTDAFYSQSTERRFHRWLHNSRINVAALYQPLIRSVLKPWKDDRLYLSLDTSMLWDRYCMIWVCIPYRGRAIPVGWRVLKHGSSTVSLKTYRDLLLRVKHSLPEGVKVILLADRGFVDGNLMRYVRHELDWHYRIRIKQNIWFKPSNGPWRQGKQYHLNAGDVLLFGQVKLYKKKSIPSVYLAMAHVQGTDDYWCIISSERVTLQTFAEYGLRFDIEENFLDDKSNGFNLQKSKIRDAIALSRLCFVIAIATLFLTLQGTETVEQGQRRRVDPHWQRGASYFKIGWAWVKSSLAKGWEFWPRLTLSTQVDPDPAYASKWQLEEKRERLEFTVRFAS